MSRLLDVFTGITRLTLTDAFILSILFIILTGVCIIDWRTRMIPDTHWIMLTLLGGIRIICGYVGLLGFLPPVSVTEAAIGCLIVSVPLLLIAMTTGGFGGGDIKLMGAAGIFLGWQQVVVAFCIGVTVGGLIGAVLLLLRYATRKTMIAFGPYLALGILIATLWGVPLMDWYVRVS